MNELKFRIWNDESQLFIYWKIYQHFPRIFTLEYIRDYTEQFIGIKDKNGIDIYVKDIIDCVVDYNFGLYNFRAKVEFEDGCYVANGYIQSREQQYRLEECGNIIVIGNIHENSNILND